jgi:tetratricopeptide (TPR) repeat protein
MMKSSRSPNPENAAMRPLNILFCCLALMLGTACPIPAYAGIGQITDQEYRELPPYCQQQNNIVQGHGGVGAIPGGPAMWLSRLGPSYYAVHHYCWAMIAQARASRTLDPKQRALHLASVLGDLGYAIDNSTKDFVLLPEMLVRRGDFYKDSKRYPESAKDYLQAIQLKPDYAVAYARLSDFYKRAGQTEEAKKTLLAGLRQAPKSRMLQAKLERLK